MGLGTVLAAWILLFPSGAAAGAPEGPSSDLEPQTRWVVELPWERVAFLKEGDRVSIIVAGTVRQWRRAGFSRSLPPSGRDDEVLGLKLRSCMDSLRIASLERSRSGEGSATVTIDHDPRSRYDRDYRRRMIAPLARHQRMFVALARCQRRSGSDLGPTFFFRLKDPGAPARREPSRRDSAAGCAPSGNPTRIEPSEDNLLALSVPAGARELLALKEGDRIGFPTDLVRVLSKAGPKDDVYSLPAGAPVIGMCRPKDAGSGGAVELEVDVLQSIYLAIALQQGSLDLPAMRSEAP